jgi:ethanolamine transporter EutH
MKRWGALMRGNSLSVRAIPYLCSPSFLFLLGDWILGVVPEDRDYLAVAVVAGIVGFGLAVLAPLLTAAAAVGLSVQTVVARDRHTVLMWIIVVLSILANLKIMAVLKRCCI